MDPKTEARRYADMVDNIDSIEAVDESTVKIDIEGALRTIPGIAHRHVHHLARIGDG